VKVPRRALATCVIVAGLLLGACGLSTESPSIPSSDDKTQYSGSTPELNLLIVAGQSNAEGWESLVSDLKDAPRFLTENPATSVGNASRIMWVQPDQVDPRTGIDPVSFATPQFLPADAVLPLRRIFGIEVGSAEVFNPHRTLVVKVAEGGTSLENQWNPMKVNGLFDELVTTVRDARLWASTHGYAVHDAGLIWMQGESDAFAALSAEHYEANLRTFIDQSRQRLGLQVGTPFVLAQTSIADSIDRVCPVHRRLCSNLRRWSDQVRRAQAQVAGSERGVFLVDTASFARTVSGLHLDAQATYNLGLDLGKVAAAHPTRFVPVPPEKR